MVCVKVVSLILEKKRLVLRIMNNGTIALPAHAEQGGIGLSTVRERVKTVDGVLKIEDGNNQQVFVLEVPLSVV